VLMAQSISKIQWADFSEALPCFVTIVLTPLSFSIATGLSLGIIAFTITKLVSGKWREITPLIWVLTALFLLRYAYLAAA